MGARAGIDCVYLCSSDTKRGNDSTDRGVNNDTARITLGGNDIIKSLKY